MDNNHELADRHTNLAEFAGHACPYDILAVTQSMVSQDEVLFRTFSSRGETFLKKEYMLNCLFAYQSLR